MVALIAPGGTRVEVEEHLAEKLTAQGWKPVEKPKGQSRSAKK